MITASRLRKLLTYDRASGVMRWRAPTNTRIRVGSVAGSDRRDGARKITIEGKSYLQHRLIVFHQTGKWPAKKRRNLRVA